MSMVAVSCPSCRERLDGFLVEARNAIECIHWQNSQDAMLVARGTQVALAQEWRQEARSVGVDVFGRKGRVALWKPEHRVVLYRGEGSHTLVTNTEHPWSRPVAVCQLPAGVLRVEGPGAAAQIAADAPAIAEHHAARRAKAIDEARVAAQRVETNRLCGELASLFQEMGFSVSRRTSMTGEVSMGMDAVTGARLLAALGATAIAPDVPTAPMPVWAVTVNGTGDPIYVGGRTEAEVRSRVAGSYRIDGDKAIDPSTLVIEEVES
jgi:hypothetical protein